jgi:hypothetical protein
MLAVGDEIRVKTVESIQIPPRSDIILAARLAAKHSLPATMDGLFRPAYDLFPRAQVLAPHAILRAVQVQDQHFVKLKLRNPTAASMTIRGGILLGFFSPEALAKSVNFVDDAELDPEPGDEDPPSQSYQVDLEAAVQQYKLPPAQRNRLLALLIKYRKIFDVELGKPPVNAMGFEVSVDIGDHQPVRSRIRKMSPDEDDLIRQEVVNLMKNNIIVPCESPWGAPVLVVPKPQRPGEWRAVTDLRLLNKCLRKDVYPLPRAQDLFNLARGSHVFSTLDAILLL